ncbi:hypothetical protein J5N97_026720 [Dioscorea zingiberensis]|uniref:Uncharacterized protein n=1 Tax=Dioscorea zingiberensis TaxID=325984 RepID=A0A9D5H732_9LILI|nr:hypothetical protein J5N97_026720 [Dioscorea zingiberensis]
MTTTPFFSTSSSLVFSSCLLLAQLSLTLCCTFTITNNCQHPIWPGTLAGAGTAQLPSTGFRLEPGRSTRLPAPPGWSGRIWARTGCTFGPDGAGKCETGDCGGRMECGGAGALPPATLFEVTLGEGTNKDYYDISLVDGYNLPLIAAPRSTQGGICNATGCASNLNLGCPKELQMEGGGNGVVGCRSACEVFGLDEYCCSGEYGNPGSCKPSGYSGFFKRACPSAYSYAFDDATSTFTCNAFDYNLVFCPPPINSLRKSNGLTDVQPNNGNNNGKALYDLKNLVWSTKLLIKFIEQLRNRFELENE